MNLKNMSPFDVAHAFSEWLDSNGLMKNPGIRDRRTHGDLAREFLGADGPSGADTTRDPLNEHSPETPELPELPELPEFELGELMAFPELEPMVTNITHNHYYATTSPTPLSDRLQERMARRACRGVHFALIMADAPGPDTVTAAEIQAFREGWAEADAAGRVGSRVRAGLAAVKRMGSGQ